MSQGAEKPKDIQANTLLCRYKVGFYHRAEEVYYDTLYLLVGAKYFSTLDIKSGYWQVEMKEANKC